MQDYFTPDGHISTKEVRKQLLSSSSWGGPKISKDDVDNIIGTFWFQDYYNNFITIPDVFEQLKQYLIKNKKISSRFNFYQFYIGQLISSKTELDELHRIGVEFELLQKNDFDVDLFAQVIKKTKASKINLNWLKNKQLVWEIEGKLSWAHHSITEYLAADYIISQKKPIQTVRNLIVLHVDEDNSDNIKPSWLGVVRFLLESSIGEDILNWLLDTLEVFPTNLTEDLANVLAVSGPNISNPNQKQRVFNIVYDTYQTRKIWLPVWARKDLVRFFTIDQLKKLENHIKQSKDAVETYVHRGNVVAVVDQLIREKIITKPEQVTLWKNRFITYALDKNDNGVLQRHSLHALSQFPEKDGLLIAKLMPILESPDSLVREAFIQYCYESAPNTHESIDVMVKAILSKSKIYGRYGLYAINTTTGFNYLVEQFIDKPDFLYRFIDDESIFGGDRKEGDFKWTHELLEKAEKNVALKLGLQQLVITALKNKHLHQIRDSFFLRSIALHLATDINNVLGWVLEANKIEDDNDRRRYVFNLEDLLPEVLTQDNWQRIFSEFGKVKIENIERYQEGMIYSLRFRKVADGQKLFEEIAAKLGFEVPSQSKFDDEQRKRDGEIYKEFKFKLEPAKGQFITDVFEYYLNNRELIEKRWTNGEKSRLIYLAYEDGIKRLDPKDFTVTFEGKEKRGGRFRWSQQAMFYGDLIKIVKVLVPQHLNEPEIRQHIINFVPYSYSDDHSTIEEIIQKISVSEIAWLNNLYSNPKDDRRYLVPESYIYFIEHLIKHKQNIGDASTTIASFLLDSFIDDWVQAHALELLSKINKHDEAYLSLLINIFDKTDSFKIKEEANSQLIKIFSDYKAIDWRFNELEKRMAPFDNSVRYGVHEVGALEDELHTYAFISPLMEIQNEEIFEKFLGLLEAVIVEYKKNKLFSSYLEYIWSSLMKYISNFERKNFFKLLASTETWLEKVKLDNRRNIYFQYSLENTRKNYINELAVREEHELSSS